MLVSGPYLANAIKDQAPELDGKWGVTTVPKDVTGTSLFAGSNLGVWKGSDNVEAPSRCSTTSPHPRPRSPGSRPRVRAPHEHGRSGRCGRHG